MRIESSTHQQHRARARSCPLTTDPLHCRRFRGQRSSRAAIRTRTTPRRDRRPPSAPSAAAGRYSSYPACEGSCPFPASETGRRNRGARRQEAFASSPARALQRWSRALCRTRRIVRRLWRRTSRSPRRSSRHRRTSTERGRPATTSKRAPLVAPSSARAAPVACRARSEAAMARLHEQESRNEIRDEIPR
jgi:hypothetical protein